LQRFSKSNHPIKNLNPLVDNHFPLNIPVKPYIKHYLHALYGSTIIFTPNNYFGIVLASLLQRPLRHHYPPTVLTYRVFDKFDDTLTVYLPKWWLTKYEFGHTLTNNQIISVNKLFEERFEEDLLKACSLAAIYNVEIKQALEEFCMRHNISIEEHITYETLRKKEYRKRMQILKENIPLNRPTFYKVKSLDKKTA